MLWLMSLRWVSDESSHKKEFPFPLECEAEFNAIINFIVSESLKACYKEVVW